ILIPPAAHLLFKKRPNLTRFLRRFSLRSYNPKLQKYQPFIIPAIVILFVLYFLAKSWRPLGIESHTGTNIIVVAIIIALALGSFAIFQKAYPKILSWCLAHKAIFL